MDAGRLAELGIPFVLVPDVRLTCCQRGCESCHLKYGVLRWCRIRGLLVEPDTSRVYRYQGQALELYQRLEVIRHL